MQALGRRRTGAAVTLFLLSLTVLFVFGTSAGPVAAQDTQQLVWQGSVVRLQRPDRWRHDHTGFGGRPGGPAYRGFLRSRRLEHQRAQWFQA